MLKCVCVCKCNFVSTEKRKKTHTQSCISVVHECVHFCIFVFGSMHDTACAVRLAERILSRLHQNFTHYFKARFAMIIFGNQCVKKCACCNQSDCPLWQILHSPALFSVLLRCYQARHKVFSSIQRLFNSLQVAGL